MSALHPLRRSRRGVTLLEILIATTIMVTVMAVSVSVIRTGMRVATLNEQTVSTNDSSRLAGARIVADLRQSGNIGGVYVTSLAGPPILINPIFTLDSAATPGTDALWLIVPSRNFMQSDCARAGSAAVVTQASVSGAPLQVNCTGSLAGATTLLVTNFTTAALISVAATTGTTISYNEASVVGFSNNPTKGAFQRGDFVIPVEVVRYEVTPNPVANSPPILRRQVFNLNPGGVALATPFGAVGAPIRGEDFLGVEDLQIAWGTGTPPALTFASLHGAAYQGGNGGNFGTLTQVPSSVRVNVVGRTFRAIRDESGGLMPYLPLNIEDHVPAPVIDGFRRTLYRRRVELLNMGALNL